MSRQSIEKLREALAASPGNDVLGMMLAEALAAESMLDDAEAQFREVLSDNPVHHQAQMGLAEVFARQGRESEALVLVEEALERQPDDGPAAALYVKVPARDGQVGKAVEQYKELVRAHPDFADDDFEETYGVARRTSSRLTRNIHEAHQKCREGSLGEQGDGAEGMLAHICV